MNGTGRDEQEGNAPGAPLGGEKDSVAGAHRLENALSRLLILGIAISSGLIGIGAVGTLISRRAGTTVGYSAFVAPDGRINSLLEVVRAAGRLEMPAVLMLGVLLLIATPVARVAFSLLAFAKQRDRMYVGVTLIVLGVLVYSVFFGGA